MPSHLAYPRHAQWFFLLILSLCLTLGFERFGLAQETQPAAAPSSTEPEKKIRSGEAPNEEPSAAQDAGDGNSGADSDVATDPEAADEPQGDASADVEESSKPSSATNEEVEAESGPPMWRPLVATAVGVFVVLALMIKLKSHAFVALILGALTISCFVPLEVKGFVKSPVPSVIKETDPAKANQPVNIVNRVTGSLGGSVVGIGVLIAMAAIIGKTMLVSGAADRIVQASLNTFGEKRAALAMMVSGFILSIPVFFDTVFYLLVPLARSLYRRTKKNYLLYLCAIAAGGGITHTLVPPTPGPLIVVEALPGVQIGTVIFVGLIVGFPSALVGLVAASWLNRTMPIEMRPLSGKEEEEAKFDKLPSLTMSLAPVLLPVLLITVTTIVGLLAKGEEPSIWKDLLPWFKLIGKPDLAMILAALFSIYLCYSVQGHSLKKIAEHVEDALLSGGVIILITAAGGAFGGLLAMTEIHVVVKSFFPADSESGGLIVMVVAYLLASLLKVAQGSSTVAMIITSSLVATIATPLINEGSLGFHPAYLVPVIGAGSLMGSWMNDSGFWVFAKMGGLTEGETLRSWTILLSILSLTGFVVTLCMALAWPSLGA